MLGLKLNHVSKGAPGVESLYAPFTISLIDFYFIIVFIKLVVTITGIFMSSRHFELNV